MIASPLRSSLPLVAGTLILAACSQDTGVNASTGVKAHVRVMNVAAGVSQLSFDILNQGGNQLNALIPNGSASGYRDVSPGDLTVRITPAMSGASVDYTLHAEEGKSYSVLAITRNGALTADVRADTGAIVPAGMTKLRVVHEALNAPAIDIWRTQPDFATPTRVMFPFAYSAASPYLQSTAGAWSVYVTLEGSTTPIATTGSFDVPAGERRTVVVLDNPSGGVMLQVVPD